ncbi:allophanate hydrolase subunit 1 [Nocardioides sp. HM23]|uniref:5-oxoprolinase subunit B family protein n=1 Tax=Nocardioides bizhenqiangii TaxID=3095076 RepID=UPI002AC9FB19|nr:allophanate hydrolase subunit 1 [Nocardioides sp. HM23]MDZ5620789.1 allophanate hydrolase subunit 1 [Nocardioides sp. HM23]
MNTPRLLPYGDRALLVEVEEVSEVVLVADAVRSGPLADLVDDVVPGARSVLLLARPGVDPAEIRERAETGIVPDDLRVDPSKSPADRQGPSTVEIPVTYDGPDLAEVARMTGLSEEEVVAAHTGTPWRVAFGGFAPGFAYLVGGDPRLEVPRRDEPRTQVPTGAVGLAGEFSGVYPRESPGGWQLIGRTEVAMWDLDRDPPALLDAGATVRFLRA